MKPILFNTEMVRAILDGRKTVTRRALKPQPPATSIVYKTDRKYFAWTFWADSPGHIINPPYQPGDILWVRETWCKYGKLDDSDYLIEGTEKYYYRADGENPVQRLGWDEHRETPVWRPSIHMPREAARIFLRVTDVRIERLQKIMDDPPGPNNQIVREGCLYGCDFIAAWYHTIKPADRAIYGWDANPWVWVIEFERVKKEDE